MINETFLFDTYALIEILNKNKNYEKYTDAKLIINDFIFAEFCYKLLKEKVSHADNYINEVAPAIIHTNPELIKEAMAFRIKHNNKNLSMTDCISYIMAVRLGIKFLTGDKEFENFEGVEFVK